MGKETPMMRQYQAIKEKNKDSILFFRLGDFYEMFGEDARTASRELELVLTSRDRTPGGGVEREPMCGVPYHSSEGYIARLVAKGYKVAICEQIEDPSEAKGIVDRAVMRVITPGTVMDTSMLDEGCSNYLCSLYFNDGSISAVSFADLSTGEISVSEFSANEIGRMENEISTYSPSEVIMNESAAKEKRLAEFFNKRMRCLVQVSDSRFDIESCMGYVENQFGEEQRKTLSRSGVSALGALIGYLSDTQKTNLSHLRALNRNRGGSFMELDGNTIRNLELVSALRSGEKRGSLLWVLDKTKTPMGRRMIRAWILRPLLSAAEIRRRHAAVGELVSETVTRGEIMRELRSVGDIERLIGKIVYGNANCRDLKALSSSIQSIERVAPLLEFKAEALTECAKMDTLSDIAELIETFVKDVPPFSIREGEMIKDGADIDVDRLRGMLNGNSDELLDIEARERERTGKKLKIGFNRVFGYYIEIPRSSSDDVPPDYVRKQTLANCERFITDELKKLEAELLTAKDKLARLEYDIVMNLCTKIAEHVDRVQETSRQIAMLDIYCSFAETAVNNSYVKPEIEASGVLEIKDGRHPVVELMLKDTLFVANDVSLKTSGIRAAIITGPNMAGKSTYMRQTALIVLMAQIGAFVPAREALIGLVDRVFTRIGASDDLSSGKSTFMVEMTEVSYIMKNATAKSLLILDEIGRGTSTYDGMSVAKAVLEHCAEKLRARVLFATHYHELTAMETELESIVNLHITAKKRGDEIIFLRRISAGCAGDSYGIEVANLAGVPDTVIARAKEVLMSLENDAPQYIQKVIPPTITEEKRVDITEILEKTDINTISPLEALNLLYKLKTMIE